MNKTIKLTIVSLLFSIVASLSAGNKPVIAIFDFYDSLGRKSTDGTNFSLVLFAELSATDKLKMVEREALDKVIKERKLNRSGLTRQGSLKIAAIVSADYIVTGRIFRDEGEIIINLKLTRCSDGKISGKSFFTPVSKKKDYLDKITKQATAFTVKTLIRWHLKADTASNSTPASLLRVAANAVDACSKSTP